ncbi:MAG: hypothetical protein AAFO29_22110, partial [Actinomycetota bacterium]
RIARAEIPEESTEFVAWLDDLWLGLDRQLTADLAAGSTSPRSINRSSADRSPGQEAGPPPG